MSLNGLGDTPAAQSLPALFPVPEPEPARADPSATDPAVPGASRRRGGSDRSDPNQPRPPRADDAGRQLVFFGADAADPSVADLAGLLAGPGEVVRMGGTARLAVRVDAAWRVHVLVAELALRGLAASWEPTEDQRHAVRTSYTRLLKPLAVAWLDGPTKRPPAAFHLTGRRLRLWLAAAGTPEPPTGFLLRLGADDQRSWDAVGAALAAAGLAGTLLGPEEGGPAYRITGRRRLARLAELVGPPPPATPPDAWP
ncbi:hypothetical protein ACQPZK_02115 [Micromonospora sp. CA-249363]|uniref:hypothetical protein n=1 Tax=Micromonospora sp. CA-249363 TaxID=3239963 RepID=UPI003D8AFF97